MVFVQTHTRKINGKRIIVRKHTRKHVKSWHDGDSGTFTDGTRFRLAGVRAPEKYQFGGKKATKTASGMSGDLKEKLNGSLLEQVMEEK
jgi:endonuclease YncB( thermonuclease family)